MAPHGTPLSWVPVEERVGALLVSHPHVLIAMKEISLRKFAATVRPGGPILYNSPDAGTARILCIPASSVADKLGSARVANEALLGALLAWHFAGDHWLT